MVGSGRSGSGVFVLEGGRVVMLGGVLGCGFGGDVGWRGVLGGGAADVVAVDARSGTGTAETG